MLVNNAGTSFVRSLEELTDDDWQQQWDLHVMGPMRLMRAAGPRMADAGGGRIVNVCSSAGKRPSLTNPAYAVTKAAQLSLSRVFADRYAADGVLVNAVAPGAVTSPLWTAPGGLADQAAAARGISREEALEAQAAKIPLGRLAEPAEVAAVIVFLCSAAGLDGDRRGLVGRRRNGRDDRLRIRFSSSARGGRETVMDIRPLAMEAGEVEQGCKSPKPNLTWMDLDGAETRP